MLSLVPWSIALKTFLHLYSQPSKPALTALNIMYPGEASRGGEIVHSFSIIGDPSKNHQCWLFLVNTLEIISGLQISLRLRSDLSVIGIIRENGSFDFDSRMGST